MDTTPPAADAANVRIHLWQSRVLDEATRQARSGHYEAAERTLGQVPEPGWWPNGIDLLARIRAQQGRYQEARLLWRQAAEADPQSATAYLHAANVAQTFEAHPQRRLRSIGLLAALGLAVVLAVFAIARFGRGGAAAPPAVLAPPADSPAPVPGPIAEPPVPQPPVEIEPQAGLLVERHGDESVVTFEGGLFASGTRLTARSRVLLEGVGRDLSRGREGVEVEVVGDTDELGVLRERGFTDNVDLALRRAVAAVEVLRRESGLPASSFVARAAGRSSPANELGRADPARRTVEIRVRRVAGAQAAGPTRGEGQK